MQAADQAWKQVGPYGINSAHRQHAAQWVLAQFRQVQQVLGFLQYGACLLDNALACGGGVILVAGALEQADAQLFLQLLYSDTQGGLADIALLSRLAKVAGFGQGYKVAQFC